MQAAAQGTTEAPSGPVTASRRGALDPRLLRYAHATRRFLVLAVVVGGATALLVLAQGWLIASVVADGFVRHESLAAVRTPLLALAAVVVGRALLAWMAQRAAHRASASAKSDLRNAATAKVAALGPTGLDGRSAGSWGCC